MKKSILMISAILMLSLTSRVLGQTRDTTKKTNTSATPSAAHGASDVVSALASNPDYSTALTAIRTARLDSTLKTGGPYTVFAPDNAAFSNFGAGRLDSLMKDPVKLTTLLKGHIVTGKYAKADIIKALNEGKGKATLTTLNGQVLTLSVTADKKLQLSNGTGGTAMVTLYDLYGANGVVNGINGLLLPAR